MRLEDVGLVGNCQFSALVHRSGAVVWCCLPRFDAEPVFSTLLDEARGGQFLVSPEEGGAGEQRYLENTNVLETVFQTATGRFRVVDFAPRFQANDRAFRPTQLFRLLEPLEGTPRVRVVCQPRLGWSQEVPAELQGSHHIAFSGFASPLRLTTDVPLSYLTGQPFSLTGRRHLVLAWGAPVEEPLAALSTRFLDETLRYWRRWVKHCNIPALYQQQVIRSALALKLHCFEDTGAILAAMTTSLPESPGAGRNWDYRYCWLRDAYYAVDGLRLLGHFEEREAFVGYLLDVAGASPELRLAPVYRIDGTTDLAERVLPGWAGYEGEQPIRVGNGAALHVQNDVFGEMALALTPVFLDDRFAAERTPAALRLLEGLARRAMAVVGTPDAGIWEYRTPWQPQTFSTLMCWAAVDRMARVATRHAPALSEEFAAAARRIRTDIVEQTWSAELGGFASVRGGTEVDASLLQMAPLRFLPGDDPRLRGTIDAIQRGLTRDGWLLRYRTDDGFGTPAVSFVLCNFWLVVALAATGRAAEARTILEQVLAAAPPLGLLSEDYDPRGRRWWGNFPQVYSHVGLIHAAFAASPRWSEVL
ncbi:MAG TPA: glycoside hydrolase family 15 protein [Myxococcaceae bacterium]|nr:glycoside hydrolase family 15 protein [Myxococcaceae bacterium]